MICIFSKDYRRQEIRFCYTRLSSVDLGFFNVMETIFYNREHTVILQNFQKASFNLYVTLWRTVKEKAPLFWHIQLDLEVYSNFSIQKSCNYSIFDRWPFSLCLYFSGDYEHTTSPGHLFSALNTELGNRFTQHRKPTKKVNTNVCVFTLIIHPKLAWLLNYTLPFSKARISSGKTNAYRYTIRNLTPKK